MTTVLFSQPNLRETLSARAKTMSETLHRWNDDALLNAPQADVVEQLADAAVVEWPQLVREEAYTLSPTQVLQHGTSAFTGRPVERHVMQFTLVVPFTGPKTIFTMEPDHYLMPPPVVAALKDGELHLTLEDIADPVQARAAFDRTLDAIEQQLDWARTQIEAHNAHVRGSARDLVATRRQALLDARNLQADLGYPVRRRSDADTFSVPIPRRKLRPARTPVSSAPFRPEPAFAAADYEAALKILGHARNTLERNPTTVAGLGEEDIRNLLLMGLNTGFEGAAAGEVFNRAGKTDILIRVEDRHIFIGECKIWKGVVSMTEALDQIFKYLVWRDTKAAILLFIRNVDVTAVIEQSVALIEADPHYKRTVSRSAGERYDFVMTANDDPQREIKLAFLPFALRTKTPATAS